jgi:hypothetical protein
MSTTEEWRRDCAYCRQPITLRWKNGPMRSEGVRLVVDQIFHEKCWDKFWADYNGKQALPRGAERQRWPGTRLADEKPLAG